MDEKPVISVRNISKKYYLGSQNSNIFRETLLNILKLPYRQFKKRSTPIYKQNKKIIWALDDINFDIYDGERVGIIGKNGAGKSTLLKILSRLVYPTTGEVVIRGRVTSLLEVGTGFNGNLTGRENIYLNASLHGLEKKEIDEIYDDIVEFSEVQKFLDTPVKRYSSGMKMRLAFAVAAHLDPDILLLDEVLAVGDISFQQKCLQRVEKLTSEGRTILFVSHSMDAISRFCDRCIWIDQGKVIEDGPTEDVMNNYVEKVMKARSQWQETIDNQENQEFKLVSIRVINTEKKTVINAPIHKAIGVEIVYDIFETNKIIQPALHFKNARDIFVFAIAYTDSVYMSQVPKPGRYVATVWIPPNFLNVGLLYVNLVIATPAPHQEEHLMIEKAVSFNVYEVDGVENAARGLYARDFPGVIRPLLSWETEYNTP